MWRDRLGVLGLAALLAAGCDRAELRREDASAADTGAEEDTGATRDAGTGTDGGRDAQVWRPPDPPAGPGEPAPLTAEWFTSAGGSLAAARPVVAAPEAPRFAGACPAGWTEVAEGDDPVVCEPWSGSVETDCPSAEVRLPGRAGCEAVGAACPVDDWPAFAPEQDVVYVRPGATSGDGTRAAPFGTVRQALDSGAGPGAIVALARGRYTASVSVGPASPGVTLRGACPAETVLAPSGTTSTALRVQATGVTIEELSVEGGRNGVLVESGASATLRSVEVTGSAAEGVVVRGMLDASRLRVLHTGTDGLLVQAGAVLTLLDAELGWYGEQTSISKAALRCAGTAASCEVTSVYAHDGPNDGITFSDGAIGTLREAVIERAHSTALYVTGASLDVTDAVVRDTRARPGGTGHAVGAFRASGTFRRLLAERNADDVFIAGDLSRLTLSDAVLRDTLTPPDGKAEGVICRDGARLVLDHVAILRCADTALGSYDPGSIVSGGQVQVVAGDGYVSGISAYAGSITLDTVSVAGAAGPGVFAQHDATVTLNGLTVRGSRDAAWPGHGLLATGAIVRVTGAILEQGAATTVVVGADLDDPAVGAVVTVRDVAVVGVAPGAAAAPEGILVEQGRLEGAGLLVVGATGRAIRVTGSTSSATLDDVAVADLRGSADGAVALVVEDGGRLEFNRARLELAGTRALFVGRASLATLVDLVVRGAAASDQGAALAVDRASITLGPARFEEVAGVNVGLSGATSFATLRDVTWEGAGAGSAPAWGLRLEDGGRAEISRASMRSMAGGAMVIAGATSELTATDVTLGGPALGYGIVTSGSGQGTVERLAVTAATGLAAGAYGTGSALELVAARIEDVAASPVGDAVGLGAFDGARLTLDTFEVASAAGCGLQIAGETTVLEATGGRVARCGVALCLPAGLDDARVADIALEGNDRDVDRTARSEPPPP